MGRRRGWRDRILDHQFGMMGGIRCIGGLVIEAVVIFGIGNDDKPIVGEYTTRHFL